MRGLSLLVWLTSSTLLLAQDMPLSQILKEGETWQPVTDVSRPKNAPGRATDELAGERPFVTPGPAGRTYRSLSGSQSVAWSSPDRAAASVKVPLIEPAGIVVSPDEQTLYVADAGGQHVWAFRLTVEGEPIDGAPYCPLRVRSKQQRSEASAVTMDAASRLYVATPEGINVFDPTGRLSGVITTPIREPVDALWFGGEMGNELYVQAGSKRFRRVMLASGRQEPTRRDR